MKRFALFLIALILIGMGLIVLPLPLPFGALMIVIGLTLLISVNATAADWVQNRRARHPRLNGWLTMVEGRFPGRFGDVLRRTAPPFVQSKDCD